MKLKRRVESHNEASRSSAHEAQCTLPAMPRLLHPPISRALEALDLVYFDNCFASLSIIVGLNARGLGSDAQLQAAWVQVVRMSPLLQMRVEGSGTGAVFRPLSSEQEWPTLKVAPRASDDEALATARRLNEVEIQAISSGGLDAQRSSVRLNVVRGDRNLFFAICSPHHFCDGVAIGSIIIKLYFYALLPKLTWWLIDRMSTAEIPTFWQMTLKSNHLLRTLDHGAMSQAVEASIKYSPDNFRFAAYDIAATNAAALKGLEANVATVSREILSTVLPRLRAAGVTLTSAFGALAIKLLAALLDRAGLNPDGKLLSTNAMDARRLGKWDSASAGGTKTGNGGTRASKMPVVANYTFACHTQVPFAAALQETVEAVAVRIKVDFDRVRDDATFRAHAVAAGAAQPLPSSQPRVGCSSIVMPRIANRAARAMIESRISFGPVPRVWFYVLTCGSQTTINVDVALPLHICADEVRASICECISGSVLEPFFAAVHAPVQHA